MMREYTGPAWTTYLGQRKGIADERGQCLAVKEADVVNGLSWLRPAPLDNTCALASPSSRSSTRASCGLTHTLTLTLTLTAYGLTRGRARAA